MPEMTILDLTEARAAEAKRASQRERSVARKQKKAMAPARRPIGGNSRMYAAARQSRLTEGFGTTTTSADAELSSSLSVVRARSRALIRDVPHAKRAKRIVQNNVIGSGIGMQSKVMSSRGELNERVNDDVEETFENWCKADSCHTGGGLCLSDMERLMVGETFEGGEIFVRKHYRRFGSSKIPFALEVIEPERVIDEFLPNGFANAENVRMGVETDAYHRPTAYWIRRQHPGELRFTPFQPDLVERIPADQIYHLRIIDRWPQTRAIPWLHSAVGKLNDMGGYSEAEIIAARAAASYMGVITTPNEVGEATTDDPKSQREMVIEPGIVERLTPGDEWNFVAPNRPNAAMDPFMRLMLREVAAGADVSYESLSRDYSQSNYSSSRLALLDDRDLWKVLQLWFVRSFREQLHAEWMQIAVLSGAIKTIDREAYALNPEKFNAVHFKPRGWGWIDPQKEVEASILAIRTGLSTLTAEIAKNGDGRDLEDVIKERANEMKQIDAAGLKFDSDPVFAPKTGAGAAATPPPATDPNADPALADPKPPQYPARVQ